MTPTTCHRLDVDCRDRWCWVVREYSFRWHVVRQVCGRPSVFRVDRPMSFTLDMP